MAVTVRAKLFQKFSSKATPFLQVLSRDIHFEPRRQNMTTYYTEQKIIDEIHSHIAKNVSDALLSHQLISHDEYLALTYINQIHFPSLFAEIAPEPLDISGRQSDV
ncbi:hypothetical protein KPC83_00565 [Collinsella sp. zg1085]|uniref:hypothetical protein n=1 Tax=Collinsella sp. zg1085 TaxID=2844380 RepID=UPI001C0CBD2C|nr:hypothetical protein [Collinsella sp. zg1085]QWT17699.1 hypothetical protein KPC83_00565 [Collinsella sp. zg1085]